jgi:hypothetical protein
LKFLFLKNKKLKMVAIKVKTYLGDVGVLEAEPHTLIQDIKLRIEEMFDIDITDQLLYTNDNDIRTLIESSTIGHIKNIFVDLDVPGLLTEEEHRNLFSGNVSFIREI